MPEGRHRARRLRRRSARRSRKRWMTVAHPVAWQEVGDRRAQVVEIEWLVEEDRHRDFPPARLRVAVSLNAVIKMTGVRPSRRAALLEDLEARAYGHANVGDDEVDRGAPCSQPFSRSAMSTRSLPAIGQLDHLVAVVWRRVSDTTWRISASSSATRMRTGALRRSTKGDRGPSPGGLRGGRVGSRRVLRGQDDRWSCRAVDCIRACLAEPARPLARVALSVPAIRRRILQHGASFDRVSWRPRAWYSTPALGPESMTIGSKFTLALLACVAVTVMGRRGAGREGRAGSLGAGDRGASGRDRPCAAPGHPRRVAPRRRGACPRAHRRSSGS